MKQPTQKAPADDATGEKPAEGVASAESNGEKGQRGKLLWSATLEPLAPGWAGRTLLARAAAYAKHRDYYGALFDPTTMEPLIASEPFVRALDDMLDSAKLAKHDQTTLTPDDVRREFLAGRAGMALTWPSSEKLETAAGESFAFGIVELPGSKEVFNPKTKTWQERRNGESVHVPLLSVAGRLASVTAESAHPAAAADLLSRLSGDPWGTAISSASTATAPYRAAQTVKPQPWTGGAVTGETLKKYGEAMAASLARPNSLSLPRISGVDRYMKASSAAHECRRAQSR
jgi:multiple sugar transport system substrate-binding protein